MYVLARLRVDHDNVKRVCWQHRHVRHNWLYCGERVRWRDGATGRLHMRPRLRFNIHDDDRVCGQHGHVRCLWRRLQLRGERCPAGGVFVLCWLRLDGANLCCMRHDNVQLLHDRLRRRERVRRRVSAARSLRCGLLLRGGQYRRVQRAVHGLRGWRHVSRRHRVRCLDNDVHRRVPHRVLLPRLERPGTVHDVRRWLDVWRGACC